jgi:hypothetical protein
MAKILVNEHGIEQVELTGDWPRVGYVGDSWLDVVPG